MRTVLVRYRTTPEYADTNERMVRAVFAELEARGPTGLRYRTYRLADGVTFLHLASVDDPEHNPLFGLPAFQSFQSQLKARCVEPPQTSELHEIAAYGGR